MGTVSMFLLFLILNLAFTATSRGSEAHRRQRPACGIVPGDERVASRVISQAGGIIRCSSIDRQEFVSDDECSTHSNVGANLSSFLRSGTAVLEKYAEAQFFNELAARSVEASDCQLQTIDEYQTNPQSATALNRSSWKIFESYRPALGKMIRARMGNTALSWGGYLTSLVPGGSGTGGREYQSAADALEGSLSAILSQIPFGGMKEVKDALETLALNPTATEEDFNRVYAEALRNLRSKIQDGKNWLARHRSEQETCNIYVFSPNDKEKLMSSPAADELLRIYDPTNTRLGCRLKSRYRTGPVVFYGGATIVVTLLTAGATSPLLGALASVPLAAREIATTCPGFTPTLNMAAQPLTQCSPLSVANSSLETASALSCGVSVLGNTHPFLAPYALELRAARQALRSEATLASDPGIQIIREGARETRLLPNGFREVTEADGVTYTYNQSGSLINRTTGITVERTEDFVVVGARTVRDVATPEVRERTLKALEDYLAATGDHTLIRKPDGGALLVIKYLRREDAQLLSLMTRAVRSGAITEIEAGNIVGEKVLSLLTRLGDIAPTTRPLRIRGAMDIDGMYIDRQSAVVSQGNSLGKSHLWSQQELENFDRAIDRLGIRGACQRLYRVDLSECRGLTFTMDARDPASIRWSAIFPRRAGR